MANYVCVSLLLLYFCLLVDHVNKLIIFCFLAFVYDFKNTISIFVAVSSQIPFFLLFMQEYVQIACLLPDGRYHL